MQRVRIWIKRINDYYDYYYNHFWWQWFGSSIAIGSLKHTNQPRAKSLWFLISIRIHNINHTANIIIMDGGTNHLIECRQCIKESTSSFDRTFQVDSGILFLIFCVLHSTFTFTIVMIYLFHGVFFFHLILLATPFVKHVVSLMKINTQSNKKNKLLYAWNIPFEWNGADAIFFMQQRIECFLAFNKCCIWSILNEIKPNPKRSNQ